MHPRDLSIADFSYELPDHRIAAYPLAERDASKLLIYRHGTISEDRFAQLAGHLPDDALLVLNKTRVVEARLLFQKPSGAVIELFCLEPDTRYPDITVAMGSRGAVIWKCLIGGASKWKKGTLLHLQKGETTLTARWLEKTGDAFLIGFEWQPASTSFAEVLEQIGAIPLPPYIKRAAESADAERYQTVYAEQKGSVAAPTAGLHFTPFVFEELRKKNIPQELVTLHVGAGTFKPVKSATLGGHDMHQEEIELTRDTIARLATTSRQIIPVGTTSLRTIESLYWLALRLQRNPEASLIVEQWDPYGPTGPEPEPRDALALLLTWMDNRKMERLAASTRLLIVPGYRMRLARGLITNFHQPQSTLLLLVAALVGDDWKRVYRYALDHEFRFLSYGDACLFLPHH